MVPIGCERVQEVVELFSSVVDRHQESVGTEVETHLVRGERADVERVVAAGAHAILVGESLMRSKNIVAKVKELLGHED